MQLLKEMSWAHGKVSEPHILLSGDPETPSDL
jgi:hypothetical protein